MRIDDGHYDQPAGIRRAEHAHSTVVARDVLDHPINGVVRVSPFVDVCGILRTTRWTGHDKLSFRLELAANILESKDESFVNQRFKYAAGKSTIGSVDAVGRSLKEYGQGAARGIGRVNDRV